MPNPSAMATWSRISRIRLHADMIRGDRRPTRSDAGGPTMDTVQPDRAVSAYARVPFVQSRDWTSILVLSRISATIFATCSC